MYLTYKYIGPQDHDEVTSGILICENYESFKMLNYENYSSVEKIL